MSSSDLSRLVDRENDILYRKVNPDFWDTVTGNLKPMAFADPGKNYAGVSFFVKRFKTPYEVLNFFHDIGETRRIVGISSSVTPTRMYEHGFRIAEIPAKRICEIETQYNIKLEYKITDGNEIDNKGHVSILNAQAFSILLFRSPTRILSREEIFGGAY